jgi:hypothetical protein
MYDALRPRLHSLWARWCQTHIECDAGEEWNNENPASLSLFGIPYQQHHTNTVGISISMIRRKLLIEERYEAWGISPFS